jgi:hypothetical protein
VRFFLRTRHTLWSVCSLVADVDTTAYQFMAMVSFGFRHRQWRFSIFEHLALSSHGITRVRRTISFLWDKDHRDGVFVVVPGLLRRRKIERIYYLEGVAGHWPSEGSQAAPEGKGQVMLPSSPRRCGIALIALVP